MRVERRPNLVCPLFGLLTCLPELPFLLITKKNCHKAKISLFAHDARFVHFVMSLNPSRSGCSIYLLSAISQDIVCRLIGGTSSYLGKREAGIYHPAPAQTIQSAGQRCYDYCLSFSSWLFLLLLLSPRSGFL